MELLKGILLGTIIFYGAVNIIGEGGMGETGWKHHQQDSIVYLNRWEGNNFWII
jgi:hypothetical protein